MAWHPNGMKQRLLDVAALADETVTLNVRPDGRIRVTVAGMTLTLNDFVEVSAFLRDQRARLAKKTERRIEAAQRGL